MGDLVVCFKTENYRSTPINLEKTSHNVYLHLTNFLSPNHQFCCGSGSSSVSLFLLLKTIFGSVCIKEWGLKKKYKKLCMWELCSKSNCTTRTTTGFSFSFKTTHFWCQIALENYKNFLYKILMTFVKTVKTKINV